MASESAAAAPGAAAEPALPAASREVVNEPARTGFDPQTRWWMNYFRLLSGQMTPEGKFHYREALYKASEERDCKRCEANRDWLFTYSPVVRFLSEKIEGLNGKLDASNVVCRRCPARLLENGEAFRQSGGFSPGHGILICANEISNRKHLEDTLAHEMVHAWDNLRWNVDWMGDKDLKHAACTEVSPGLFATVAKRCGVLTLLTADSSIYVEWGVSVVEGIFHARQLVVDTAVPALRSQEGHTISHGATPL